MKNWIIVLIVLILPLGMYFALKNNKEMSDSLAAQAANNRPKVIKFASPMCLDCKKVKAEIEPLKPIYQDRVDFIEIDATANDKKTQEQIEKYGVSVVPTIIFIDEVTPNTKKIEGFLPKNKIEQHIKELIHG